MENKQAVQKREGGDVFDTKKIVTTLHDLMEKVTEKDVNSETVNAACNCAARITDMLRVHLDVERMKAKYRER